MHLFDRPSSPQSRLASLNVSRRQVLAGGLLAATVPLLAGCFSGGGGSGTVYSQPSGDIPQQYKDRQRVVMWSPYTAFNAEILQKNIDLFNESQKDIFCEVQLFEGYNALESKIASSLQAKQVPDITVMSDISWNRFYLNDTLEPLNSYFDDSFGTDSFHEQFLKEGTVKNDIWWVPFGRSTPLFYFNRQIFQAVGLPDRAPKTFSEYREWGKELAGYSNNGTNVAMRAYTGADDWYFQGSAWAFGGGYSDGLDMTLASEGTIKALEFDRAFIHDDKSGYLAADPSADFIAGAVASVTGSTGSLTGIASSAAFDFGCGFLPKEENTGVPTGGGGISILAYASEDRKKAAWEVLKFLSSGDAAVDWTLGTGYMPTTKAALESDKVKAKASESPNYQVAIDQLDVARMPDVVRRYVAEAVPEMQGAIQAVYSGGADPEKTLKTVQANLEPALEKVKAKYDAKVGG